MQALQLLVWVHDDSMWHCFFPLNVAHLFSGMSWSQHCSLVQLMTFNNEAGTDWIFVTSDCFEAGIQTNTQASTRQCSVLAILLLYKLPNFCITYPCTAYCHHYLPFSSMQLVDSSCDAPATATAADTTRRRYCQALTQLTNHPPRAKRYACQVYNVTRTRLRHPLFAITSFQQPHKETQPFFFGSWTETHLAMAIRKAVFI